MSYSIYLQAVLASVVSCGCQRKLRSLTEPAWDRLFDCVRRFVSEPVTPPSMAEFEKALEAQLREMGRQIVEAVLNHIESTAEDGLPPFVDFDSSSYRRLKHPTANRHVAALFGTITLWRHGYRPRERDSVEATIFPLEQALGLLEGATPALAERVGVLLAEAGATQRRVLCRKPKRWRRSSIACVMPLPPICFFQHRLSVVFRHPRYVWTSCPTFQTT